MLFISLKGVIRLLLSIRFRVRVNEIYYNRGGGEETSALYELMSILIVSVTGERRE